VAPLLATPDLLSGFLMSKFLANQSGVGRQRKCTFFFGCTTFLHSGLIFGIDGTSKTK
jgi:hypothetical protein